jgi:predicted ATPase
VLIVDSPEAHLHPRGQSRIGCFLAQAAACGQILIETHSDHVLNGIRLAVRDGLIAPADVAIYFFECNVPDETRSKVLRLLVDKDGNLDLWPTGFFDQSERDLARLAGWA